MSQQLHESDPVLNRSMPPGIIIPELVYPDMPAAVTWLCTTFGFKERLRIGNHRSQLVFAGLSAIVAVQATDQTFQTGDGGGGPVQQIHALMVRIDNLEQHYAHVRDCGAKIVQPPTDFPYGERQYTVEDLASHRWTFTQSIADVDPRDWGGLLRETGNTTT